MRAYVINIMVVLIIFPVILQTDIKVIMLSIGGQGDVVQYATCHNTNRNRSMPSGVRAYGGSCEYTTTKVTTVSDHQKSIPFLRT